MELTSTSLHPEVLQDSDSGLQASYKAGNGSFMIDGYCYPVIPFLNHFPQR
jgi:hypothetical protein